MAVTDPALVSPEVLPQMPKIAASDMLRYGAGIAGALLVLALGKWLAARRAPAAEAAPTPVPSAPSGQFRRILLAADGSECSERAVQQVLAIHRELRDPTAMQLHLINVQRPVSGDVSSFVSGKSLEEYHQERSAEALASARSVIDASGLAYQLHQRVGSPGPTIAEVAQAEKCDLIVMGSRGMGGHTAALLGSVAQSTIEHAGVPVLVVK
jgi:nucleotide-binding universal stress UspA family protein